ncbi:MAG: hypothetical protein P1U64_07315 [Alcanivoracaceae bacterium]|nr:hypothetical protein [Alcanivoracaceae bacterium]
MSENEEKEVEVSAGEGESDQNPIAKVLSRFLHCLRDAEEASSFIDDAVSIHNKKLEDLERRLEEGQKLASEENDNQTQAQGIKLISESLLGLERVENANVPETLEKALFLNLFSDFDTFTGDLLLNLYKKRPDLYSGINKTIDLSDVLNVSSIDDLKNMVLANEIEGFRRKSYVEQFQDLEKRFGVSLTNFEKWPDFVEATQRRNLFMHCNGEVSQQYIDICTRHRVRGILGICPGDKLFFEDDYIFSIFDLMSEVAVKLTHVLWRKLIDFEIQQSDDYLNEIIFECLRLGNWRWAMVFSDFALSLPKISAESSRMLFTINAAIAYKFSGSDERAMEILDSTDWSAACLDFRMAERVLREDYEASKELMLRLGESGDYFNEYAYHDWPIFRDFRRSEEFLSGYQEVYGYTFLSEVKRSNEDSSE